MLNVAMCFCFPQLIHNLMGAVNSSTLLYLYMLDHGANNWGKALAVGDELMMAQQVVPSYDSCFYFGFSTSTLPIHFLLPVSNHLFVELYTRDKFFCDIQIQYP
ncbi:unnamed protein product [Lupinus luteus]|uniref:Uncharacterized protein n=1 Tax=Lupinus luteus TaxID=3873 RepID=A0AAV1X7D6_LUPLU